MDNYKAFLTFLISVINSMVSSFILKDQSILYECIAIVDNCLVTVFTFSKLLNFTLSNILQMLKFNNCSVIHI